MSQISTLVTGAGVVTGILGQDSCPAYIVIGDVDTANPIQALLVEIEGRTWINIQTQALITAFMKWMQESANGPVGSVLKLATGRVEGNTNIRLTNAGATTPIIYGFSDAENGVPFEASAVTINPTSNQVFERFSALMIATPANVTNCEIEWTNGRKDTLSIVEVDALLNFKNATDADGKLGTITVIDNTDQSIKAVRVNTNATAGGTAVLPVKIPQAAWDVLNQKLK